jgi:hypothetical protein
MARPTEELLSSCLFHYPASIHYVHPLAHLGDDSQIVRDEQKPHLQALLQVPYE